jgi:tagaturonate reductase
MKLVARGDEPTKTASSLPLLSRDVLKQLRFQKKGHLERPPESILKAPETILQIGSGNFLKGFVDDFVQLANAARVFSGRVVSVQRKPDRRSEMFARQDGLYTLVIRGIQDGRPVETKRVIASISRLLLFDQEWENVVDTARNPATRVVVTNATEAGLAFDPFDALTTGPAQSFPGKLTQLLWQRWLVSAGRDFDVAVIPCELLEENGLLVRELILTQASAWNLDLAFSKWVKASVHFASTLVDRIVVGTPAPEQLEAEWQALGYRDELLNCAEPFAEFDLQADEFTRQHFPISRACPEVKFVDDLTPYRVRKIRILNGPHTTLAALGKLLGLRTVREAINDEQLGRLIEDAIFKEVIPALPPDHESENATYARAILARFKNPSLEHKLVSICLNCSTKAGTRIFPSIRDFMAMHDTVPERLILGLASVILVQLHPDVQDAHAEQIRDRWRHADHYSRGSLFDFAHEVLANQTTWSKERIDLKPVATTVAELLLEIGKTNLRQTIARRFGGTVDR